MESSSGRREISSGRRESSSGRRESERRAVASDEGPAVASGRAGSSSPGKSQEVDERSSNASVRREKSNSSLQKASPREESFSKCNPKEETVDKGSPWEEALPPVPSSGRVSRSIENVLSRCVQITKSLLLTSSPVWPIHKISFWSPPENLVKSCQISI